MAFQKGNKYSVGVASGRKPHFETPDLLEDRVNQYFNECQTDGIKATITGLALALGFSSRSSFDDYSKRNDEFSYIVKRAKLVVENYYETSGQTIDIFALKNMGWADRSEIDHTTKGQAINTPDLSKYTEDELRIIAELQRKGGTSEA